MSTAAYKLTLLLKARDGLSPDDFADLWLAREATEPLGPPGLIRHVFDRLHAGAAPIVGASAAPYDAADETWWERKLDAANWFVSHEFESWLARRRPLLARHPDAIGGQPEVIWERQDLAPAEAVKVIVIPVAKRSLTVREFVEYWTGHHAELALSGPNTKERLLQLEDTPAQSTPSPFVKSRYDGVGTITFETADALRAEFASDYYQQKVAPDEPNFSDPQFSLALLTTPVQLR